MTLDASTATRKAWRPCRKEDDYEIDEIIGALPAELAGTLYRNTPTQRVAPVDGSDALHLFDGDGMIHAFRFEDGRVFYRNRFVRNESFLREEAADRFLWPGIGAPADPFPGEPAEGIRQQHNTNIVSQAGRLFAMVENAPPFELDPKSLDPIGLWDLDGEMKGYATTAHPKVDGQNGEMLLHGYQFFEPYLQLYAIADGRVVWAEAIDAPFPTLMHDLALTEHYTVFPLCPLVIDFESVKPGGVGADAFSWQPERGMCLGVRERREGAPTRWIPVPTPAFLFHFGNAYEKNGRLLVDAYRYLEPDVLLEELRTIRAGHANRGFRAEPCRYEIDLEGGTCREQPFDERPAEFPRHDDRYTGYESRYAYAVLAGGNEDPDPAFSQLIRYDRAQGNSQLHRLDAGEMAGEPVFVPRAADAAEGDGFILSLIYDARNDGSELRILDASAFGNAPIARLKLRHRIPMGFHGNWVGAARG